MSKIFGTPTKSDPKWEGKIDTPLTGLAPEEAYENALVNKVFTNPKKPSPSSLDPKHGVVFKLQLDPSDEPLNFGDKKISTDAPYTTKY